MKRIALLFLLIPGLAWSDTRMVLEYGRAATINFEMYDTDGTLDVDEADGGAEVTVHCDGDAGTTATNDFADEGSFYSLDLTAAELDGCANVALDINASLRHMIFIETCGSPNAQHMLCPGGLYTTGGTTTVADNSTTVTELSGDDYADDDLNDFLLCIVEDIASGDPTECRIITDYNGTTEDATHEAFSAALPNGGEYIVIPDPRRSVNVDSSGRVDANVVLAEGSDWTNQVDARIDARLAAYDVATETNVDANETKIDTIDTEVGVIDSVVDDLTTNLGTPSDLGSGATFAANAVDMEAKLADRIVATGTCDSGSTSTCVDATLTQADDYWNGHAISFPAIDDPSTCIFDFTASSDTLEFWTITTNIGTQAYEIVRDPTCVTAIDDTP